MLFTVFISVPDTVTSQSESKGCPVLYRNTFGLLIVLAMIVIVIIVFGSRIPGVETMLWHDE